MESDVETTTLGSSGVFCKPANEQSIHLSRNLQVTIASNEALICFIKLKRAVFAFDSRKIADMTAVHLFNRNTLLPLIAFPAVRPCPSERLQCTSRLMNY